MSSRESNRHQPSSAGSAAHCANCGAILQGPFCAACGQKRIAASDRRFGSLLRQFIEAATDLDGRLWGSLRALLLRPGRLSAEYVEGRRAPWMSPVGLFLLVNLLYFVSPLQSDFATPFDWEMPGWIVLEARDSGAATAADAARLRAEPGPLHSRLTAPLVQRRVERRDATARAASKGERGYDYGDYRQAYDSKVPEVSKALAIVHVPLLAVALMLMFRHRQLYYAEHFVVALHLVAFYMATILIFGHGIELLRMFTAAADWQGTVLNWLIRVVLIAHIVMALRRVYAVSWLASMAATVGLILSYVAVNLYIYRPLLFLTVFALT